LPSSYVGAGIVEGQWFLELRSQEGSGVAILEFQTVCFPRPKAPHPLGTSSVIQAVLLRPSPEVV